MMTESVITVPVDVDVVVIVVVVVVVVEVVGLVVDKVFGVVVVVVLPLSESLFSRNFVEDFCPSPETEVVGLKIIVVVVTIGIVVEVVVGAVVDEIVGIIVVDIS